MNISSKRKPASQSKVGKNKREKKERKEKKKEKKRKKKKNIWQWKLVKAT